MLRTNTALWRIAFLSGLGVIPAACGGRQLLDEPSPCTDPEAQGATGLAICSDGRLHRREALACSATLPEPPSLEDRTSRDVASSNCASNAECTEKPYGFCAGGGFDNGVTGCRYGCMTDADCGSGYLCECGAANTIGTCTRASCQTNADCAEGMLCAKGASNIGACGGTYEFACETPRDECRVNADCPETRYGSYCELVDGRRICLAVDGKVACGRPFLVEGSARLANIEPTKAWLAAAHSTPDCARLSPEQRFELAQVWAELGLMEHASIAAFARFTLQLLSVGAPAELVEQSQRALADELLHAQICFGLASAYAGVPIGPGPLPTEHALDLTSLEDIAALTLHEGCVGETIAALEASEALARATDPAVCAALTRIEADERRHAELGWRFVTWAVRAGGASVQRRIQRELAELLAQPCPVDGAERVAFEAAAHGVLSASLRTELRAAALRDVVLPCSRALLPAQPGVASACAAV